MRLVGQREPVDARALGVVRVAHYRARHLPSRRGHYGGQHAGHGRAVPVRHAKQRRGPLDRAAFHLCARLAAGAQRGLEHVHEPAPLDLAKHPLPVGAAAQAHLHRGAPEQERLRKRPVVQDGELGRADRPEPAHQHAILRVVPHGLLQFVYFDPHAARHGRDYRCARLVGEGQAAGRRLLEQAAAGGLRRHGRPWRGKLGAPLQDGKQAAHQAVVAAVLEPGGRLCKAAARGGDSGPRRQGSAAFGVRPRRGGIGVGGRTAGGGIGKRLDQRGCNLRIGTARIGRAEQRSHPPPPGGRPEQV